MDQQFGELKQEVIWKDIPGYTDNYEISNTGVVRRKAKVIPVLAGTVAGVLLKGKYKSVAKLLEQTFGKEIADTVFVKDETTDKRRLSGFKSHRTILTKEHVALIQELAKTKKVRDIWRDDFPNISYSVIYRAANGTYLQK